MRLFKIVVATNYVLISSLLLTKLFPESGLASVLSILALIIGGLGILLSITIIVHSFKHGFEDNDYDEYYC